MKCNVCTARKPPELKVDVNTAKKTNEEAPSRNRGSKQHCSEQQAADAPEVEANTAKTPPDRQTDRQTDIHAHIHTHTYIRTYTYTHTYTYIYTYI